MFIVSQVSESVLMPTKKQGNSQLSRQHRTRVDVTVTKKCIVFRADNNVDCSCLLLSVSLGGGVQSVEHFCQITMRTNVLFYQLRVLLAPTDYVKLLRRCLSIISDVSTYAYQNCSHPGNSVCRWECLTDIISNFILILALEDEIIITHTGVHR